MFRPFPACTVAARHRIKQRIGDGLRPLFIARSTESHAIETQDGSISEQEATRSGIEDAKAELEIAIVIPSNRSSHSHAVPTGNQRAVANGFGP